MKFYLSSFRLGNEPQQLVAMVGPNKRTAVIANSLDFGADPERRQAGVDREITDLTALGLQPEELDLRTYFGRSAELFQKLPDYGLLWVRGGNVFILRRAFKASGLDTWLLNQQANQNLVYAGYSAGVCVLSPSLKGLELVDDPTIVSAGYSPEIIWEGLGLIDFAFAPHYRSDHPESAAIEKVVSYYQHRGIRFRTLPDGEVIILT